MVRARFQRELPHVALRAVLEAVRAAREHLGVAGLAERCERTRRTLCRHLRSAGMPPPVGVIAWGKILVASHKLATPGESIESVALYLGAGGASELVHLFRRHGGWPPGAVRSAHGLQTALELLAAHIARPE